MPLNPTTYLANAPLTAVKMNADLYSYVPGNAHFPNGLLFHSLPPIVWSNMRSAVTGGQGSSAGGTQTQAALQNFWKANIDNSALFGPGADFMGPGAAGHFEPQVAGTSGLSGSGAGWYLAFCTTVFAATTTADASGALLYYPAGTALTMGDVQLSSTTHPNGAYALDFVNAQFPNTINPGGYCGDTGASFAFQSAADYANNCCTFGALWAAPLVGNNVVPASLPAPPAAYTGASAITSALLNGNGLAAPLQFLNNKPILRVSASLTTSIPNNGSIVPTLVPLGNNVSIDNWGGWNTSTSLYTVPVSGVYLVHGVVNYSTNATAQRVVGIQVNGTTNIWGASYTATGILGCRPAITRLLDLQAGDTVALVTCQNTGAALALAAGVAFSCRLNVMWMSALAGSNGSVSFTPPNVNFRWQAGTPGSQLPALFNQHLTNDLYFLIQRPYLLSRQTVQQTGLAQNTTVTVTTDSLAGAVHGSPGDNYGGWTSGAANKYTAVVPGWYLIVAGYSQAAPSASPAHCIASVGYLQSGGANQGASGAFIQGQRVRTTSSGFGPGAEIVCMAYLRAGDFIQPAYGQQDGGATFSTNVSAGQNSFFGAVWISE